MGRILKLLKTKTVWAGIAMVAVAAPRLIAGDFTAINEALLGLGMIFGRDAILKQETK
jgi:hypothetical protein